MKQWRNWIGALVSLLVLGLALLLLFHLVHEYHWRDVTHEIHAIPWSQMSWSLLLTVGSYLLLTGYDALAVREVGGRLPYPRVAFTSFVAYTFSNTLGFALVTGTSVRYRCYSALGLTTNQIAGVVFFCSVTFFLGLFLVGGLALTLGFWSLPPGIISPLLLPWLHIAGMAAILLVVAYVLLPFLRETPLTLRGFPLPMPRPKVALGQLLIACGDWMAAAGVFYCLLMGNPDITYWHVLTVFVVANLLGVIAHVPGGIGVFESVVTLLLSPVMPASQVLGALILYRLIYYVLPFGCALLLFAGNEALSHRHHLQRLGQWVASGRELLPPLISLGAFAAGTVLLLSGVTPGIPWRLDSLLSVLPLPLLEMSHLLGSISGILLLLLARSLYRRYDAAYRITQALLMAGMVFSMLKGLDWEEATLLGLLQLAMLPCRSLFYRKGSLIHAPFTPGWMLACGAVLLGVFWVLMFSYRHIDYSHDLWWHFASDGMASRGLRAMGGVIGVAALAGFAYLLRPSPVRNLVPSAAELARAAEIVAHSAHSHGHLALLGDKALMFAPEGDAFLMYAVSGRSWVAMGDPVGNPSRFVALLWQFRELCDENDGWPVLYQVSPQLLPAGIDLGLMPFKLGEEAMVDLAAFTLVGSRLRNLRQSHAKAERDGLRFSVIAPDQVAPLLPALRQISDSWLQQKMGREKGFSVGWFMDRYLQSCPLALVYHQERLVGFANLWVSECKVELSVDLMRYDSTEIPSGIMDYLFTELLLWAKAQGYQRFNLGMAPMSGFALHPLAPFWGKLATLVYERGNRLYNFQGLRRYKEKYQPDWQPRYLLCPGGIQLPRILPQVVALISRGALGTVQK